MCTHVKVGRPSSSPLFYHLVAFSNLLYAISSNFNFLLLPPPILLFLMPQGRSFPPSQSPLPTALPHSRWEAK